MSKPALTPKQQRFVDEYLIDLNATKAAERAGYSKKTARVIGAENLTKPAVAAAIAAASDQRAKVNKITAQRVLDELALIAFSDLGELVEFTADGIQFKPAAAVSEAARRAVASVKIRRDLGSEERPPTETVEFKLWDKVGALRQLAEHLGLVKELAELLARLKALEDAQNDAGTDAGRGKAPAVDRATAKPARS